MVWQRTHDRDHETLTCIGVAKVNKRKLEPLSSIGSANYLLFSGWFNRNSAGSSDLRGSIVNCDLAMDLPKMGRGPNLIDYLVKLRDGQARLINITQVFLSRSQRKRTIDGG